MRCRTARGWGLPTWSCSVRRTWPGLSHPAGSRIPASSRGGICQRSSSAVPHRGPQTRSCPWTEARGLGAPGTTCLPGCHHTAPSAFAHARTERDPFTRSDLVSLSELLLLPFPCQGPGLPASSTRSGLSFPICKESPLGQMHSFHVAPVERQSTPSFKMAAQEC